MAKRRVGENPSAPALHLSPQEIRQGIARIQTRINELTAFDPRQMKETHPPNLAALSTAIQRALEKTFGEDTADCRRFSTASKLQWSPTAIFIGGPSTPLSDYQEGVARNRQRALALLGEAVRTLNEDLAEIGDDEGGEAPLEREPTNQLERPRRVFIVHGHEDGPREAVARFLQKIGFEPIILNEQANRNRTVIEKIEAHSDVGFAVVLLTPDDVGAKKGEPVQPRVRQNVLLELGYFIGRLGRSNVCAFKRADVEIPSDFAGVLWTAFDEAGAWKTELARELKAADYAIDWNKVMD